MNNQYLKNVSTLKLQSDKCIGCGICTQVCPHDVFIVKDKKAIITDKDNCMECGACAKNCPVGAIDVKTGVGCVYAVIRGQLTGTEPSCDCSKNGNCC